MVRVQRALHHTRPNAAHEPFVVNWDAGRTTPLIFAVFKVAHHSFQSEMRRFEGSCDLRSPHALGAHRVRRLRFVH